MWEANPTMAERNQANVAQNRLPFISDLPKKDKYKLKKHNLFPSNTNLVLLALFIF